MNTYNVYLQDKFVGTVQAPNTGKALGKVAEKIDSGEFVVPDTNLPPTVTIRRAS